MEVFSLRAWQAQSLLPDEWKYMHRWMAAQLDLCYPSFGRHYFRGLLKKQLLIPCFDGLDEVPLAPIVQQAPKG